MVSAGEVRAAIVGLGTHGSRIVRLGASAGIRFVAAADPRLAGTSLGEVVGTPALEGVSIAADFDGLKLERGDVDVVILAHHANFEELADLEIRCAELGANVVTIIVAGFDLEAIPAKLRAEVDAAAKANNVTVVSTGSQDVSWGGLVVFASAQVREVREVRLSLVIGVDGYPAEFLDYFGIGLSADGFAEHIAPKFEADESIAATSLKRAAEVLGFTLGEPSRSIVPAVLDEAIFSTTYDRSYEAGEGVGIKDTTVFVSEDGVRFVAEIETLAVAPGVRDSWVVAFEADPTLEIEQRISVPPHTVDAILLNRIADVINAPAGLISALDLPQARYRSRINRPA